MGFVVDVFLALAVQVETLTTKMFFCKLCLNQQMSGKTINVMLLHKSGK